jgi:hypothetical protein
LNKPARLGEPAGIASRAILELDSVNHAVSIEEVVAGDGFMKWVRAVPNVDASYAVWDSARNR